MQQEAQNSIFLSQDDIAFITGYRHAFRQKPVLDRLGIKAEFNHKNQLVVIADHAKDILSGKPSTIIRPGDEVDLNWMD